MIEMTNKDGVLEIALAGGVCNEIGTTMLSDLEKAIAFIQKSDAQAVVFHSTRKEGFCAGADLRELYNGIISQPKETHRKNLKIFLDRIHDVMNAIDALPMPTVGVVHGVCFGGGFELALTMDVLVAEPTARFCFPELRLGIIPCFGGIPRMKREFSNALIRDLLFTGRSINAKKAQESGWVSQLVAQGEGLNVARKVAEQICKFDRTAKEEAKKFIKTVPHDELEKEKEIMLKLFDSPVVVASLKKFVESKDVRPYLA